MNLKRLRFGTNMLKFFIGMVVLDIAITIGFIVMHMISIPLIIFLVAVEFIIFWIGIITVYVTSIQLGIKTRVFGIVLGPIPLLNIFMLLKILKICSEELKFESDLVARDLSRENEKICQTRYPILLVHGVFFRDSKYLNYWGRIPKELEKNGATLFYGNHNSANAVDESAKELEIRILEIVEKTGCEKVNIIAHSKGGLDARTAIAKTSAYQYVASLTTISTPHRGCEFADYFLNKIPKETQNKIAKNYNSVAAKLGDVDPDFMSSVYDLTASSCKKRNEEVTDNECVYYQSVGSVLHKATSGTFPLNLTYNVVKLFDGENDGLVGIDSFQWGENYRLLRNNKTNRGISHGDIIDLNKENIDGFDVREFYVQLVKGLKEKGF